MVTRADLIQYVNQQYNTKPERLFAKSPGVEVLRHRGSKKWYGIIMGVAGNKVGLDGEEILDILNVKCEPDLVLSLSLQEGYFRAYHMNKKHWLTILLNGTAADHEIYNLLDLSYEMTK